MIHIQSRELAPNTSFEVEVEAEWLSGFGMCSWQGIITMDNPLPSTWYYFYLTISNNSPIVILSSTPSIPSRRIGAVYSDHTGSFSRWFCQHNEEVRFNGGVQFTNLQNGGNGWEEFNVYSLVPPYAREVLIRAEVGRKNGAGSGIAQVDFNCNGGDGWGRWYTTVKGWSRETEPDTNETISAWKHKGSMHIRWRTAPSSFVNLIVVGWRE